MVCTALHSDSLEALLRLRFSPKSSAAVCGAPGGLPPPLVGWFGWRGFHVSVEPKHDLVASVFPTQIGVSFFVSQEQHKNTSVRKFNRFGILGIFFGIFLVGMDEL